MTHPPRPADPAEGHPGRLATLGPLLLLLPVLLGTLVAVHLLKRRGPAGPAVEVDRGGVAAVAGWAGALSPPAGGRLSARLTPLHADAGRQAFDAVALRARYPGLPSGAPFRLELAWERDPAPAGVVEEAAAGAALPLEGLLAGTRLSILAENLATGGGGAAPDPLAVLLAPSASALSPGESLQLVLWGDPSGDALTLTLGERGAGGLSLLLVAGEVPRVDLRRDLARLPAARPLETPGREGGPR